MLAFSAIRSTSRKLAPFQEDPAVAEVVSVSEVFVMIPFHVQWISLYHDVVVLVAVGWSAVSLVLVVV